MWCDEELQSWMNENYPDLKLKRWRDGAWSIMQVVPEVMTMELDFSFAFDGIAWIEYGQCEVFTIKNRFVGGWVCDEIIKRDPKLWHNEGNLYNESFQLSIEAKLNKEARDGQWKKSGETAWDICKRNPALMDRISGHMAKGNYNAAANEVSLESLYMNAYRENPKEVRSKDFIRGVHSG